MEPKSGPIRLEDLTLHEKLNYVVTIGSRIDTKLISATGTIEAHVPYDGDNYSNYKALNKIVSAEENEEIETIPIGFFGISGYERTSLKAYAPSEEFDPVKIPVKVSIANAEHLVMLGSISISAIDYEITEPTELPMALDVVLVDDLEADDWSGTSTSFQEQLQLRFSIRSDIGNISQVAKDNIIRKVQAAVNRAEKDVKAYQVPKKPDTQSLEEHPVKSDKAEVQPSKKIGTELADAKDRLQRLTSIRSDLEELAQQPTERFTTEEVVRIIDQAKTEENGLSASAETELTELRRFVRTNLGGAQLTYLGLEWPYAEQPRISNPNDQEGSWYYNPEAKRMEIRDINLTWNDNTRLYETIQYLNIHRPAEEFPTIRGDVYLQTDKPLSGLKVQWIDNYDREQEDIKVDGKTLIAAKIEKIDLSDIFRRRTFSPRRELHFKGIHADLNRLRDIENILNDVGLTIYRTSYGSAPEAVDFSEGCWIEATKRAIGEHLLRIWVNISESVSEAKKPVTYVKIFGRMVGDSSSVNAILNEIQIYLERRYASVRLD